MKIIGIITYSVFILMLVVVAGLFLTPMLPIPGNIALKIVKSGSMTPTIPVGAIVVVKPASEFAVGDVITFGEDTKKQIPTTHRIIHIETKDGVTLYTTKGDANDDPDPNFVREDEIIGKVVFWIPFAGYVLDFARKPMGFALMIALPAAVIILDEIVKIIQEILGLRKKKKEGSHPQPPESLSIQSLRERGTVSYPGPRHIDGVRPNRHV